MDPLARCFPRSVRDRPNGMGMSVVADPCPRSPADRRAIALILVLAIVLVVSFVVLFFHVLVRGETDRTGAQARELEATLIGEAVATRIVAMVNQWPWSGRFYKTLSVNGPYAFTHRSFPFETDRGLYPSGEVQFAGTVRDLDRPLHYRILLDLECRGAHVAMVWDKVYAHPLLGGAADDTSKSEDTEPGARGSVSRLDASLDGLREVTQKNQEDFQPDPQIDEADRIEWASREGKNPFRDAWERLGAPLPPKPPPPPPR